MSCFVVSYLNSVLYFHHQLRRHTICVTSILLWRPLTEHAGLSSQIRWASRRWASSGRSWRGLRCRRPSFRSVQDCYLPSLIAVQVHGLPGAGHRVAEAGEPCAAEGAGHEGRPEGGARQVKTRILMCKCLRFSICACAWHIPRLALSALPLVWRHTK